MSIRERDDNYRWINLRINPRYRLITYGYGTGSAFCLQYKGGKDNWKNRKYFVTWSRALQVVKDMGLKQVAKPE